MIRIGFRTLLLAAVLATPHLRALPEDRNQPIEIQADRAEIDDGRGVAIYAGSVSMEQGTIQVTAETLTIHTEDDQVTRITAAGEDAELARYQQLPRPGAALVRARARSITYHPGRAVLELEGHARLSQGEESFAGETIRYDLTQRRVEASAGEGEPVIMRIDPGRVRTETDEAAGATTSQPTPSADTEPSPDDSSAGSATTGGTGETPAGSATSAPAAPEPEGDAPPAEAPPAETPPAETPPVEAPSSDEPRPAAETAGNATRTDGGDRE